MIGLQSLLRGFLGKLRHTVGGICPERCHNKKETYLNTLLHLWEAIKKKHPGKLLRGVILLHDNAKPHTA